MENSLYPIKDWQYEVANGDTVLGYVEWVAHNVESNSGCDSCGIADRVSGSKYCSVCDKESHGPEQNVLGTNQDGNLIIRGRDGIDHEFRF